MKITFEFAKTKSGKVIISCIAVLILILAIFLLIPAATDKFSASFEAELPDGRVITGNITLEDGQTTNEGSSDEAGTSNEEFSIEAKVRLVDSDDKTWHDTVEAEIGDIVEVQLEYKNISSESHYHVAARDILPSSLKYIEGTTKLYNTDYPEGISIDQDNLVDNGIFIGNYAAGANAFVRFRAEIVDDTMAYGANELVNWVQVQAGADEQIILQDYVNVMVQKSE